MIRKTYNHVRLVLFTAIIAITVALPQSVFAIGKADNEELTKGLIVFLKEYKILIAGVSGFGLLSGLLAFIWLLIKLAADGDRPQEREKIIKEMGAVGLTTALLGSLTFVVSVYYSVIIN